MNLLKLLPFVLVLLLVSCKKDKKTKSDETYDVTKAYNLTNVSYGDNPNQVADIYLPANRNSNTTKVFVLVHGGGWSGGNKSDMVGFYNNLKNLYPDHAIINIGYRLGTANSPGYPKQINDIKAALEMIQKSKYNLSKQYFMIGGSAGAHLSMLYGYAFDPNGYVKGICNYVGPSDLTDPAYTDNQAYSFILSNLVGNVSYAQNPDLYAEVSPATHVKSTSPKTISFYGDTDPLIPNSQMTRLHDKLDAFGVLNESTMYPGEGHGNWNQTNALDFATKLTNFINTHFN